MSAKVRQTPRRSSKRITKSSTPQEPSTADPDDDSMKGQTKSKPSGKATPVSGSPSVKKPQRGQQTKKSSNEGKASKGGKPKRPSNTGPQKSNTSIDDTENDDTGVELAQEGMKGLVKEDEYNDSNNENNERKISEELEDSVTHTRPSLVGETSNSMGNEHSKRATKSFNNCGSQSSVNQAKSTYTQQVTCPKCNTTQSVDGLKSFTTCENCQAMISWTAPKDDTRGSQNEGEQQQEDRVTIEGNIDTVSVGYGGPHQAAVTNSGVNSDGIAGDNTKDTIAILEDSTAVTTGTKTPQEAIRRIIKRKIMDQEGNEESSSKKQCLGDEQNSNEGNNMKPPPPLSSHPPSLLPSSSLMVDDKSITSHESGGLSLNIPAGVSSHSAIVSSPLMEYAQKISARFFIPPEITPSESARRRPRGGNTRGSKSGVGKNKRSLKELASEAQQVSQQLSGSPVADGTSPDPSVGVMTQESVVSYSDTQPLPGPPPLVKSDNTNTQQSSGPIHSDIPPLVAATNPYHDPTITSIRYSSPLAVSNKTTFYSSPTNKPASLPPPLLVPAVPYHNDTDPNNNDIRVVSKNIYQSTPTTERAMPTVPPLLQVGHDEDGSVTHAAVIVDQRSNMKNTDTNVQSPAPPPALLNVPSPTDGDNGIQQQGRGTDPSNNGDRLPQTSVTDGKPSHDSIGNAGGNAPHEGGTGDYDHTHKAKKRKQKLCLVKNMLTEEEDNEGIIYATKKKKKKKKKEKDKERSHHHHSKPKEIGEDNYNTDKKVKKKVKKEKRKEKEIGDEARQDRLGEVEVTSNTGSYYEDYGTSSQSTTAIDTQDESDQEKMVTNDSNLPNQADASILYSVKMKDCLFHQIKWGSFRMAMLLPAHSQHGNATPTTVTGSTTSLSVQTTPEESTSTVTANTSTATPTDSAVSEMDMSRGSGRALRSRNRKRRDEEQLMEESDPVGGMATPSSPSSMGVGSKSSSSDSKKRKKSKGKGKNEKADPEDEDLPTSQTSSIIMESDEDRNRDDSLPSSPPFLPPSFSIYELRNKIFRDFPPRTVHAFTYKYRIKTHRPPLYWIYILKRLGGLPENCHMCRLLDIKSLKQLCEAHKVDFPSCVDDLMGPQPNMKGRKLIDISDQDPKVFLNNPEVLHVRVPLCAFQEKRVNVVLESDNNSQQSSTSESLLPRRECRKRKYYTEPDEDDDEDDVNEEDELEELSKREEKTIVVKKETKDPESIADDDCEYIHHQESKTSKSKKKKSSKKPSKTGIDHPSNSGSPESPADHSSSQKQSSGSGKKKPCPNCGYQMLRKSKKCVNCGKPFGVFTFGRRQCTNCNHINLARMSACFRCGQSLEKAPTAVPRISEIFDYEVMDTPSSTPVGATTSSAVTKHDFKLGVKKKRRIQSIPQSPTAQNKHHRKDVGVSGGGAGLDSPDEVFQDDYDMLSSPSQNSKMKPPTSNNNYSGDRYGKIPWNDADLALVISSSDTPKLCLQEVCAKVLRYHPKTDVFELLKSLNLSLEPGDSYLLKKLQALGLHPNRSPLCRLIAAEDLFALMDALEEPVPDEVHQYLGGNFTSSSILELSDGVLLSHASSSPSSNPPTAAGAKPVSVVAGDDREHKFDSTLHEIECSDGQRLAMLRSWDGEHFLCLLEVWRRYFPEVNRSHLSTTIKRMEIETKIPTSQQTNLLRSAGVISVRGAPGRLVRVRDIQRVLDDFGILLRVDSKGNNGSDNYPFYRNMQSHDPTQSSMLLGAGGSRKYGHHSKMVQLANCMSLLMDCVDSSSLEAIVTVDNEKLNEELKEEERKNQDQSNQESILHNQILHHRELCNVLNDEIAFLTVTNHSMMAEIVHLSHTTRQALSEVDSLIDFNKLVKMNENRQANERQANERQENERQENERQENEGQENERQENERQENERQENEGQENERQENERQENERQENEGQENERQENERQENERQENERQENEGQENKRQENERLENEGQENERQENKGEENE